MPLMVIENRTHPVRVSTTVGHTFFFEPGRPVMVPPNCIKRCMQAGARMLKEEDNALLEETPHTRLSIEDQTGLVIALLRDMLENHGQYREHFSSNNLPKSTYVNERLSTEHKSKFAFASQEIYKLWRQVRDEKIAADTGQSPVEDA